MDSLAKPSTLEILPDEILLEICKHLLCTDILMSFTGLNNRLTQTITQYRRQVSGHKASFWKSNYIFRNIFPQIGSEIQSLVIDSCYSILQDELFYKYFKGKMSATFPSLQRISLVSYGYDSLTGILDNLNHLNHLVEIRLYGLFPIDKSKQAILTHSLMKANNNRLTTILIDDQSSCLHFNNYNQYFNVVRLRISLQSMSDLCTLSFAVPNVTFLAVMMEEDEPLTKTFDRSSIYSLDHVTDFEFLSLKRTWLSEELSEILTRLPIVSRLSLALITKEQRLIEGDRVLSLLPSTVQQFDYAVIYVNDVCDDIVHRCVVSWPLTYPMTLFYSDRVLFAHTLPWRFSSIEILEYINTTKSCNANDVLNCYSKVEKLYLRVQDRLTLTKALNVLSLCRHVEEVVFIVENSDRTTGEYQCSTPHIPKLSRLLNISFHGSPLPDWNGLISILKAAPNVFRLDISFKQLCYLMRDSEACSLLGQRITSLLILTNADSSPDTFNEESISALASMLYKLEDIYIDLKDFLSVDQISNSDENESETLTEGTSHIASTSKNSTSILPGSTEFMIVCLLRILKELKILSICIDGHFCDDLKQNTKQWLIDNTVLSERSFEAAHDSQCKGILIWM